MESLPSPHKKKIYEALEDFCIENYKDLLKGSNDFTKLNSKWEEEKYKLTETNYKGRLQGLDLKNDTFHQEITNIIKQLDGNIYN